eukprot:2806557-Rhodomonas_salina.2
MRPSRPSPPGLHPFVSAVLPFAAALLTFAGPSQRFDHGYVDPGRGGGCAAEALKPLNSTS